MRSCKSNCAFGQHTAMNAIETETYEQTDREREKEIEKENQQLKWKFKAAASLKKWRQKYRLLIGIPLDIPVMSVCLCLLYPCAFSACYCGIAFNIFLLSLFVIATRRTFFLIFRPVGERELSRAHMKTTLKRSHRTLNQKCFFSSLRAHTHIISNLQPAR